jgi:Flp pilus assembly protein TadD
LSRLAVLSVFIVAAGTYCATAARHLRWGDSAEFVTAAYTLGITHPPGYPLYTLLSAAAVRLPLGTPFLRVSLLSALCGAAAAAVLATTVLKVTALTSAPPASRGTSHRGWGPALIGSASALLAGTAFAFAPTVWSQSTVPEVYTLSALLLFILVLLVTAWNVRSRAEADGSAADNLVPVMGLVLGLSLAHHITAVLLVPSIALALFVGRPRPSGRALVAGLVLVFVGLSLYAYLPIRSASNPALLWAPIGSWSDFLGHVTGRQYAPLLLSSPLVEVRHKVALLARALPREIAWPLLPLSVAGVVAIWHSLRRLAAGLILWAVLVAAHAAVYRIPDIDSYYIPIYGVLVLTAGVGLHAICMLPGQRGRFAVFVGGAALVLSIVSGSLSVARHWEQRDLRLNTAGSVYLGKLLDSVDADGIVVTMTDRVLFPIWYARYVEGRRPDIAIACVRERAQHLVRWAPDVRFPTDASLVPGPRGPGTPVAPSGAPSRLSRLSDGPSRPSPLSDAPSRLSPLSEAPVGSYLELLVQLNESERPLHADADLGRRVFLERSVPRGLLVRIAPAPVDSIGNRPDQRRFWQAVSREMAALDDVEASQAYAKTLAEQGMLLIERGETEAAVAMLEIAADMAPEVALCRNNLGVAYEQAGKTADSMVELEMAIELDPSLAVPRFNLSRLAASLGDTARALREIETAVALAPDDPVYSIGLSSLLEARGDLGRAERALLRASARSPDDWSAKLAYGDFLARHRRFSEAVAAYEYAEALRPGAADALTGLSRCYWALDDRDHAMSVMSRLVELQPGNPRAKYDLAIMLNLSGRPLDALPLLDDVMRILPTMWEAAAYKASVLADLGRLWEAREHYERAASLGASGLAFEERRRSLEQTLGLSDEPTPGAPSGRNAGPKGAGRAMQAE